MEASSIIIGRNAIIELLETGKEIEKIYLQVGIRGDFEKELRSKLKDRFIPVQYVPVNKLNKMTRGQHQGVIAVTSMIQYHKIDEVISLLYEQGKTPLIVVLDGVTDVRNFGAIARSAEVFGAHAIVCPLKNSALINEITFKSSAGALAHLPVCRVKSLNNAVETMNDMGLAIYAADHHSDKKIQEIPFDAPCAVILGDEGKGVSQNVLRKSEAFKIEQIGSTESLNVSVAAGIVLYEISKFRMNN